MGNDITGSSGNDYLAGSYDLLTVYGMDGNDTLIGTSVADSLYGGLGDDFIYGNGGNDYIDAGAGNDTIVYDWSYKSTRVKGGIGVDVLDARTSTQALKLNLSAQFKDFENIIGSSLNDSILGSLADNALYGGSGDDTLNGKYGSDTIDGGDGRDRIIYDAQDNPLNVHGGNDIDILDASNERTVGRVLDLLVYEDIENAIGGLKNDTLYGTDADNYLSGGSGADMLYGGVGADTLDGGAGNDMLYGGAGDDLLFFEVYDKAINIQGGAGSDTLSAIATAGNVTLDLSKYSDIENAAGAGRNDSLIGNAADNILAGYGGTDILLGNDGNDNLYGGDGTDRLYGGVGNDTLVGGIGSDTLDGGEGNDIVVYDPLDKPVNVKGGAGYDILDASLVTSPVKINLAQYYSDFEVVIGGSGNDSLRGGGKSMELYGGDGNDTICGGDGNDTLSGEADSDLLIGGKGQDVYTFGAGSGDDTIARDGINSNNEDILRVTGDVGMLTFHQVGNDMELELATGDSLLIQGWYEQAGNKIHNIIVGNDNQTYGVIVGEDGTEVADGNDTLGGTANDEQLYGLTGNDLLLASGGNDIYSFNIGDGNDTLDLTAGSPAGQVQLQFGTGISEIGLIVENIGNDLLIRTSEADSLLLKSWSTYSSQVSSIQFTDGGKYYNSGIAVGSGFINGDLLDNFVVGSQSNDFIASISGNDLLYGGSGDDTLYGGTGSDLLRGGAGNDVICLEDINLSGDSVLLVDGGNDAGTRDMVTAWRFGSSLGSVTLDISDETKFISIEDIAGSIHSDTLIGNSGDNVLYGKLPSDTLSSAGDYFDGRAGSDIIYGGDGGDVIVYDSEDSGANIHAGAGTDVLDASAWQTGANIAMAEYCHNEADKVEQVIGSSSSDSVQGSDWDDSVAGGAGNDYIDGGKGSDALAGGEGADSLVGGAGDDNLTGGSGDDSLFGGDGNDILTGGAGNDVYYWGDKITLSGNDVISADNGNSYDCVAFGTGLHPANLAIALTGEDLLITAQSGETLTLQNWGAGYEAAITQFYFQAENVWYTIDPVSLLWTVGNAGYSGGGAGSEATTVHYGNYSDGTLTGNDADEMFYGGQGNESISGGIGNDILDGGGGDNTLSGGVGHDSYYFSLDGGSDLLVDAVNTQEDTIIFANGIAPADVEFTKQGNDLVITHQNGIDTMTVKNFYTTVQPINTFIFGGVSYTMYANDMQASPAGSNDASNSLVGNLENNIIFGMGGDDYLFGLDGADILYGGDGNDYLLGYNGADYIFGGNGNDVIYYGTDVADKLVDGGSGRDTIFGAQQINLSDADQFVNIEDIIGSGERDELTGSIDNNGIWGYSGADTLNGAAGDDSIWGGNRYLPDMPKDGSYPNNMYNDVVVDDVIIFDSQAGNEYISGDGGGDILDASGETSGVSIDLSDSSKYNSLEFVIGGSGDDYIYGGNSTYTGYFWNEVIGAAPTALVQTELNWIHKLEGGAGSDTLDAGAGNDEFKRINFLELNYGAGLGQAAYDRLYSDHLSGNGDYMEAGWKGNDIIHTADTLVGGTGRDFYVFGHGYGNDVIASDAQNCEDVIWLNDIVVDLSDPDKDELNDFLLVTFSGTNDKDMVISFIDGQSDSLDLAQYNSAVDDVARAELIGESCHLTITDGAVDYNHAILQFSALVNDNGTESRQYFALTPGLPGGFVFHSIK